MWIRYIKEYFGDARAKFGQADARIVDIIDAHSNYSCVSCWHMNEVESAAMWKLYSSESGVAIRSSAGRLVQAFSDPRLRIAPVEYVDLESPNIPSPPYPVFLKRKSFTHESELRLIVSDYSLEINPTGILVSTDVEKLGEQLFVSPSVKPWVADVVRDVVKRYGLNAETIQSSLCSKAIK